MHSRATDDGRGDSYRVIIVCMLGSGSPKRLSYRGHYTSYRVPVPSPWYAIDSHIGAFFCSLVHVYLHSSGNVAVQLGGFGVLFVSAGVAGAHFVITGWHFLVIPQIGRTSGELQRWTIVLFNCFYLYIPEAKAYIPLPTF